MATLSFSPTTDFTGALVVSLPITDLTVVGGSEGDARNKGVAAMRLTIDGTVYEVPISSRKLIKGKNGGRVFWQTDTPADSGSFNFFRNAPPVFLEDDE
jgi:hypothetical protein